MFQECQWQWSGIGRKLLWFLPPGFPCVIQNIWVWNKPLNFITEWYLCILASFCVMIWFTRKLANIVKYLGVCLKELCVETLFCLIPQSCFPTTPSGSQKAVRERCNNIGKLTLESESNIPSIKCNAQRRFQLLCLTRWVSKSSRVNQVVETVDVCRIVSDASYLVSPPDCPQCSIVHIVKSS